MKISFLVLRAIFLSIILFVVTSFFSSQVFATGEVCGQWNVVSSPNAGTSGSGLVSVAASSNNNVWAVGNPFASGFAQQTLSEKWNGSSWSTISSPTGSSGSIFT